MDELLTLLAALDEAKLKHDTLERQLTAACSEYARQQGLYGFGIRHLRQQHHYDITKKDAHS